MLYGASYERLLYQDFWDHVEWPSLGSLRDQGLNLIRPLIPSFIQNEKWQTEGTLVLRTRRACGLDLTEAYWQFPVWKEKYLNLLGHYEFRQMP